MNATPAPTARPATPEQQAEITHLLAAKPYNANHRDYYSRLLPGLSWVGAVQLFNKLRHTAPMPALLHYTSQGVCPQGLQGRSEYAAVVRLTRTAPSDSGGRFHRAQPGEPIHLSYSTN